jgi:hypothetical protein
MIVTFKQVHGVVQIKQFRKAPATALIRLVVPACAGKKLVLPRLFLLDG